MKGEVCKYCDGLRTFSLWIAGIGALNWGAIGVYDFNFISWLFDFSPELIRIVYILIGLSILYYIFSVERSDRLGEGK